MGRKERRERREQRRQDEMEQAYYADLAKEAGITFDRAEWNDQDELVPKAEGAGADPWKGARLGTVHDVAHLFQVHWKTVEKWRRKDGLPCLRQWGVIRYDLSDVLRWASARKVGG